VNQRFDLLVRVLVRAARVLARLMHATMDIRAKRGIVLVHGIQDELRVSELAALSR